MLHVDQSIGQRICKNTIFTSMRKGCMSCYFRVNSQRQKISEDTAAMCCFLMFYSNLVISYMQWKLKILQVVSRSLSLQMKKNARPINKKFWGLMMSIDKPLKKKMQHLPLFTMIYKVLTIRFKLSNTKTCHCKRKEMCIRPSYKNVKTPSSILNTLCRSCERSR